MTGTAPTVYDTPYSWYRLAVCVVLGSLGGIGMWSPVIIMPALQADFGVSRGAVAFASTATLLGFAGGGIVMGWLTDRFGAMVPVLLGSATMAAGFALASLAPDVWTFSLIQGVAIAMFGSSATFAPLMADVSRWFDRRRGIATALCASGNYFAGALWPPLMQPFLDEFGWRQTYLGIAIACAATMLPLALLLRRRPVAPSVPSVRDGRLSLDVPRPLLTFLLATAALMCCVAMAMPQVHLVAYCTDLGFGAARGAEMLSVMLAIGILSRMLFGFVADRIGGLANLLLGSFLQMASLALYLFFDGLASLYIVSALFGLVQGGIVPSYALVVREYFPAAEAGTRVGIVLMASLAGMGLGGWLAGAIFDLSGSYSAAFLNGVVWNAGNVAIVLWLLGRRRAAPATA
ncbi:MAG: MFS transporter [Rhodospirillales bacterium]|nr:MFS transporter [Rhodospirillales bacterium]